MGVSLFDVSTKYFFVNLLTYDCKQLEDAEKSSKTLKATLEEVEGSVSERGYQQSLEMMEAALKAKDREITSMQSAEKARVKKKKTKQFFHLTLDVVFSLLFQIAELKKLKRDKEKAVKAVRQYAVNMEDLKEILPRHKTKGEQLTSLNRAQMVGTIHDLDDDLAHHKAYLDQLLTIVITNNPNLLAMVSEAQKIR